MSRECEFCGKKTTTGNRVSRRGMAKHRGGVGIKCTGKSRRSFKPNLQRLRAVVDGHVRRVRICSRCIRSGKLVKPRRKRSVTAPLIRVPDAPATAPTA